MANGEWGMGNGEWGMGNGEWGMGNGEQYYRHTTRPSPLTPHPSPLTPRPRTPLPPNPPAPHLAPHLVLHLVLHLPACCSVPSRLPAVAADCLRPVACRLLKRMTGLLGSYAAVIPYATSHKLAAASCPQMNAGMSIWPAEGPANCLKGMLGACICSVHLPPTCQTPIHIMPLLQAPTKQGSMPHGWQPEQWACQHKTSSDRAR